MAEMNIFDTLERNLARTSTALKGYEQQLLMARRLARLKAKQRTAAGEKPHDPDASIQRREYVKKVAEELYNSLIFTGSDNPVVEEIRQELSRMLKKEIVFTYPAGGGLRAMARDGDACRPLDEEERQLFRRLLWRVTSQKIDGSMLKPAQSLD